MSLLISAKGDNGSLEVYENRIIIKRKGVLAFMTQGLKGDKEIYIKNISSIQIKKANFLINGYIQFSFLGGKEAKGSLFEATSDENTIMFTNNQQGDFERAKVKIEEILNNISEKNSNQIKNISISDEIEKLSMLKDKGILTEDEFSKKKKELLGI